MLAQINRYAKLNGRLAANSLAGANSALETYFPEFAMNFDAIESDPNRLSGQACIRGTRITVRRAVQLVAQYPDRAELTSEFPELTDDVLNQALNYAAAYLDDHVETWQAA